MRNKKMVILLLCLILFFSFGCGEEENDPRESEIIKLVFDGKLDEAVQRTEELFEGKEKDEMLEWVNKHIDIQERRQQLYQNTHPSTKLEVQPDHTYEVNNGYACVKGRVKNISKSDISYFEVVVDLLDSEGNTLHSEYTNDGLTLKPNAMREFEIMFKDKDEYKRYKLSIGKVK